MMQQIEDALAAEQLAKLKSEDDAKKRSSQHGWKLTVHHRTVEDAMKATGTTSPRAALLEMKKEHPRVTYMPHCGAKQRLKEASRQAKLRAKELIE